MTQTEFSRAVGVSRQSVYKWESGQSYPEAEKLLELMKSAGCATTPEEVHVSPELFETGLRYHTYMRYRLLIPRLFPMLGADVMEFLN